MIDASIGRVCPSQRVTGIGISAHRNLQSTMPTVFCPYISVFAPCRPSPRHPCVFLCRLSKRKLPCTKCPNRIDKVFFFWNRCRIARIAYYFSKIWIDIELVFVVDRYSTLIVTLLLLEKNHSTLNSSKFVVETLAWLSRGVLTHKSVLRRGGGGGSLPGFRSMGGHTVTT